MDYHVLAGKCAMLLQAKPPPHKWAREELLREIQECLHACILINGEKVLYKPYQVSALLALESQLKEKEKELIALLAEGEHD